MYKFGKEQESNSQRRVNTQSKKYKQWKRTNKEGQEQLVEISNKKF